MSEAGVARLGGAGQAGQSVEVAGVSAPVAQAVRQVYEQCGGVEFAEHLVAAAEQPESPLHSLFTWDNDAAAAEWRMEQARSLVRRVHVRVIRDESADPIQVRAYLSRRELPSAEATPAGTYVAIEEVAGATDWETSVLQEINRDVARLRRKYKHVSEFFKSAVISALD